MYHEPLMIRRIPILLGLLLLALPCFAQARWCNTVKLLPEDKLLYPPLARAARVSGIVISRMTVTSTGSVSDVEIVSGYPLLAGTASEQIKKWKLTSDATAESACLALLIVDFSFEEYPSEKSKAWSVSAPNIVKIAVVTTTPPFETSISDPALRKIHRWHW